jgi:hypothetical protein
MKNSLSFSNLLLLFSSILIFSSCKKEDMFQDQKYTKTSKSSGLRSSSGQMFYALTSSNELISYNAGSQMSENGVISVTGFASDEKLLAVDFRPATGELYGVTNQSKIYKINLNNGLASAISADPFTPALSSTKVGFDFNPTVDRIRLVTNTGQNLRLNPETGLVVNSDINISVASAMIGGVAYTNSFAGAATTTLYDIDVASDKLFIQNPPNNGTLVEVGLLGVQAVGEVGFDISPDNSMAIAAIFGRGYEVGQKEESNGNKMRFYYIDLATGEATNAGKTDRKIIGIAIPTNMVTYAVNDMNQLLIMNPSTSNTITKNITGLAMGDMIEGIDMRPATSQLYALGAQSRLYTINLANGMATAVGTMPFSTLLNGTSFGFDFNPTVDRIRVVSNNGQNLRLNPITGGIAAVDPNLNPGMPVVDGAGYTNTFIGSTSTILYDIDTNSDQLLQQNPANAGTLINGKPLGINIEAGNGFDIGGSTNNAWGIFKVGSETGLYSVNLATGETIFQMPIAYNIKGFAVGLGF